jgi:hypothetical protein
VSEEEIEFPDVPSSNYLIKIIPTTTAHNEVSADETKPEEQDDVSTGNPSSQVVKVLLI